MNKPDHAVGTSGSRRSNHSPVSWQLVFAILLAYIIPGSAADRFWDGGAAGADARWTTAANWSNNVAPAANDFLIFPVGTAKLVTTNDFAANTDFSGFSIRDNYTLRGAAADLTNMVQVVSATGTLDLNLRLLRQVTFDCTVNGLLVLAAGRSLSLNGSVATFDGANGNHQINGTITDSAGAASRVIVTGRELGFGGFGNAVILNGVNNCPGPTLVTNLAELMVNGSITSHVVVASTAVLSGTGTIGQLTASGTVSPGNSVAPGRLTVSRSCTFSSSGVLSVTLAGTNPGVTHDQLNCSSSVTLGSARLQIVRPADFIPAIGSVFTILNKSSGTISGTFAGLAQGATT